MLRKLSIPALLAALAIAAPASTFARGRDDHRPAERREVRHEVRNEVRRLPARGYFDRWGVWHPERYERSIAVR